MNRNNKIIEKLRICQLLLKSESKKYIDGVLGISLLIPLSELMKLRSIFLIYQNQSFFKKFLIQIISTKYEAY